METNKHLSTTFERRESAYEQAKEKKQMGFNIISFSTDIHICSHAITGSVNSIRELAGK